MVRALLLFTGNEQLATKNVKIISFTIAPKKKKILRQKSNKIYVRSVYLKKKNKKLKANKKVMKVIKQDIKKW